MTFWLLMLYSGLLTCATCVNVSGPPVVTVGAMLSDEKYRKVFEDAVKAVNADGTIIMKSVSQVMQQNPIGMAMSICNDIIPERVSVVLASHPANSTLPPVAISFTCAFYRIPVIGLSARECVFSDKNVHSTFLRTVAPYWAQAEVWTDIVQHFGWKNVIFMHSADQEGRALLGKFQNKAEPKGIKIDRHVQFTSGKHNYTDDLLIVQAEQVRVILLYANEEDAYVIYKNAAAINLTGTSYVWIVTEQALNPSNAPQGILGLRLQKAKDEAGHIRDAVKVIANGYKEMHNSNINITQPTSNCSDADGQWGNGSLMFNYLVKQVVKKGRTGRVMFSDDGDRIHPVYDLVNVKGSQPVVVGTYDFYNKVTKLTIDDAAIVWPGGEKTKPKGIKISSHLRVVTIEAVPFIYVEPISETLDNCVAEQKRVPCTQYNSTTGTTVQKCCYGYCIDLLLKLAQSVNFTYDLHLVTDGEFGTYKRINGSQKKWTGMIGELKNGEADLIVAPMTIDPERAEHIDFTKPFKYQGLTILVKKTTKDSSLASFLQPFQDTLWILVGLSVHVVALVLYLLDRFSPFGRFKLAKTDDTEEDALNLSNAIWFAWGVLLNSGIGEGTPRSFSARVLGMVWAGFAMIIVASYTANLAAFLVLDRPEASITGIDDARLRNPQEMFKYATVKNSAVAMYFKRQVELSTMYRTMESRNYPNAQAAIEDVKKGKLQAFIWDSSRLEFEAAKECDLVTAGELFGRSGFGIGLPKNSPWTREISLQILSFHQGGFMEELDGQWIIIKDSKCPEKDTSPATLGLTNMAGVFMMVAGGIVTGVFLIFVEIAYKRHRGLKEKELELAKTAADRWRGNIEKRKTLRRTLLAQQQEMNKANCDTGPPGGATFSASFPGANRKFQPPTFEEAIRHPTVRPPGIKPGGYQPVATTTVKRNPLYTPEDNIDTLA